MAQHIREADLSLIRRRVRIDEVAGEYIRLRNSGGSSLNGLCPFHTEKSASFSVSPSRGLYYCFDCGAAGDVIDFFGAVERLTFAEAVHQLARRYGVRLRSDDGPEEGDGPAGVREPRRPLPPGYPPIQQSSDDRSSD